MTLKKKIYSVCAVGVLAAGMMFAKEQGFGQKGRLDFLATRLSLTDAQKQSAQSIFDEARTAAKPVRDQLRETPQALTAAVKAGRIDSELTEIATRQGALMGQLSAIRAKGFSKLYAQLTPEQRVKADQMHQRMTGMGHRRQGEQ
jgi:Spy/CpxP family protein refolding chaperone